MKSKNSYNGHKNHNAWNVSLWIWNDEGLYNLAKYSIKNHKTKDEAAKYMLDILPKSTPDGVIYNKTNIRLALREM